MGKVVNRENPCRYSLSADEVEHPESKWVHNPPGLDGLLDSGVPPTYWKVVGDDVEEMSAVEKAAVDDAAATAAKESIKSEAARGLVKALLKTIADVTGTPLSEVVDSFRDAVDGG